MAAPALLTVKTESKASFASPTALDIGSS